jgi:hypothetical protein
VSGSVENGIIQWRDALEGQGHAVRVNYEMVDTDKDGKISAAEFKAGCSKGWIQKADTSTVKEMPKQ